MHRCPPSVLRAVLAAGVLLGGTLASAPAGALSPTHGTARVDGLVSEWTPADEVAPLEAVTPPHPVRATLSLRYDCEAEVLYVRVAAAAGVTLRTTDPDEVYLRLGGTGKLVSGTEGGFAWVAAAGDGAEGFEMSASVPPGEHRAALRVHAKAIDDSADGYETIDLSPRSEDLSVGCGDPAARATGVSTAGDPADPADPADPVDPGAVNGAGLVRTGLADGAALLVVGGLLIGCGVVALRLRRRLAAV